MENYRPIAIIPIFLKLFSRILLGRVETFLSNYQSVDQAGFRAGYSCDDNLFTLTILQEKCKEWNLPLWIAAVDFRKAFDTVDHCFLWSALAEAGVPSQYIRVLKALYSSQTGVVAADHCSRLFKIMRGTKQGDPISPILFNTILETIMRRLKNSWSLKKYGISLGNNLLLQNLRFADDLLLMGTSLKQVEHMLNDLANEASLAGLQLHQGKTKILSNRRKTLGSVTVHGEPVEVLPISGQTEYLGRLLSFKDYHSIEVDHRLAKAWKKFYCFKSELCSKDYPLKDRLKLFDAIVTPTMLYGSCSWTMTAEREKKLVVCQRRMLRRVCCVRKTAHEDWVEYMKRSTRTIEEIMHKHGLEYWIIGQRRRKWKWAGRVARMSTDRWAKAALLWEPSHGCRRVGRPCMRWEHVLEKYVASFDTVELIPWQLLAESKADWHEMEASFIEM